MRNYKAENGISILACFLMFLPITTGAQAETKVEKYKSQSIPGLELCKEFKAYLERHPDEVLYCGLIPDADFKDFRLPELKPAPRGLGERITFQSRTVPDENYRTFEVEYQLERYQKSIKSLKKLIDSNTKYKIGVMDINHDGSDEPVLVKSNPDKCLEKQTAYTWVKPYHESQNIDSDWIGPDGYSSAGGEPFYYKGRVYLMDGSKRGISIHEPSKFGSNKLFTGRSVCRFIPL